MIYVHNNTKLFTTMTPIHVCMTSRGEKEKNEHGPAFMSRGKKSEHEPVFMWHTPWLSNEWKLSWTSTCAQESQWPSTCKVLK